MDQPEEILKEENLFVPDCCGKTTNAFEAAYINHGGWASKLTIYSQCRNCGKIYETYEKNLGGSKQ